MTISLAHFLINAVKFVTPSWSWSTVTRIILIYHTRFHRRQCMTIMLLASVYWINFIPIFRADLWGQVRDNSAVKWPSSDSSPRWTILGRSVIKVSTMYTRVLLHFYTVFYITLLSFSASNMGQSLSERY